MCILLCKVLSLFQSNTIINANTCNATGVNQLPDVGVDLIDSQGSLVSPLIYPDVWLFHLKWNLLCLTDHQVKTVTVVKHLLNSAEVGL